MDAMTATLTAALAYSQRLGALWAWEQDQSAPAPEGWPHADCVGDAPAPPPAPSCEWTGETYTDPRETPAVPPGWRVACLSGWPHSSHYTWRYLYQGVEVVDVCENGRVTWHARSEAKARRAERRTKARANHDTYVRALIAVREVLAADPVLRSAVVALYESDQYGEMDRMYGRTIEAAGYPSGGPAVPTDEPGRRAALALAWVGWGWCPGQEGGALLTPGRVPVGVRGALGLPRPPAPPRPLP